MARLVVMRKGGGGKVAINPDLVTHVRSAAGAFTDIFVADQQIAVEGTFEEVLARLTTPDPKAAESAAKDDEAGGVARPGDGERREEGSERRDPGLVFGRLGR